MLDAHFDERVGDLRGLVRATINVMDGVVWARRPARAELGDVRRDGQLSSRAPELWVIVSHGQIHLPRTSRA